MIQVTTFALIYEVCLNICNGVQRIFIDLYTTIHIWFQLWWLILLCFRYIGVRLLCFVLLFPWRWCCYPAIFLLRLYVRLLSFFLSEWDKKNIGGVIRKDIKLSDGKKQSIVEFQQQEVNIINTIMEQTWAATVSKKLTLIAKDHIDRDLCNSSLIESHIIHLIHMGSISPCIEAVEVKSIKDFEVVIDISFEWKASDSRIEVDVKLFKCRYRSVISNIHIKGILRIHLYQSSTPKLFPFSQFKAYFVIKPHASLDVDLKRLRNLVKHQKGVGGSISRLFWSSPTKSKLAVSSKLVLSPVKGGGDGSGGGRRSAKRGKGEKNEDKDKEIEKEVSELDTARQYQNSTIPISIDSSSNNSTSRRYISSSSSNFGQNQINHRPEPYIRDIIPATTTTTSSSSTNKNKNNTGSRIENDFATPATATPSVAFGSVVEVGYGDKDKENVKPSVIKQKQQPEQEQKQEQVGEQERELWKAQDARGRVQGEILQEREYEQNQEQKQEQDAALSTRLARSALHRLLISSLTTGLLLPKFMQGDL